MALLLQFIMTSGKLIQHGKEVLVQAGAYFKGNYSATVCKGINVKTNLELILQLPEKPAGHCSGLDQSDTTESE